MTWITYLWPSVYHVGPLVLQSHSQLPLVSLLPLSFTGVYVIWCVETLLALVAYVSEEMRSFLKTKGRVVRVVLRNLSEFRFGCMVGLKYIYLCHKTRVKNRPNYFKDFHGGFHPILSGKVFLLFGSPVSVSEDFFSLLYSAQIELSQCRLSANTDTYTSWSYFRYLCRSSQS